MTTISAIAISGLQAATRRLDVSASNVANAQSSGPLPSAKGAAATAAPAAYTPLRVNQVEVAGGGTQANVSKVSPATSPVADPQAPFADGDGMVAMPNVDFASEMVDQVLASYNFAANIKVLQASDRMTKAVLDLKA